MGQVSLGRIIGSLPHFYLQALVDLRSPLPELCRLVRGHIRCLDGLENKCVRFKLTVAAGDFLKLFFCFFFKIFAVPRACGGTKRWRGIPTSCARLLTV